MAISKRGGKKEGTGRPKGTETGRGVAKMITFPAVLWKNVQEQARQRYLKPSDLVRILVEDGLKNTDDFIPLDDAVPVIFPDMLPEEIAGANLRNARKAKRLTQDELGRLVNTDKANISAMENGRRPISKAMAKKLAEVLDESYKSFL